MPDTQGDNNDDEYLPPSRNRHSLSTTVEKSSSITESKPSSLPHVDTTSNLDHLSFLHVVPTPTTRRDSQVTSTTMAHRRQYPPPRVWDGAETSQDDVTQDLGEVFRGLGERSAYATPETNFQDEVLKTVSSFLILKSSPCAQLTCQILLSVVSKFFLIAPFTRRALPPGVVFPLLEVLTLHSIHSSHSTGLCSLKVLQHFTNTQPLRTKRKSTSSYIH